MANSICINIRFEFCQVCNAYLGCYSYHCPMLAFRSYIAVVKSGLIKDKNADSISDFSFDFISLELTAALFLGYLD